MGATTLSSTLGVAGLCTLEAGAKIDNQTLTLGSDNDITINYDELRTIPRICTNLDGQDLGMVFKQTKEVIMETRNLILQMGHFR